MEAQHTPQHLHNFAHPVLDIRSEFLGDIVMQIRDADALGNDVDSVLRHDTHLALLTTTSPPAQVPLHLRSTLLLTFPIVSFSALAHLPLLSDLFFFQLTADSQNPDTHEHLYFQAIQRGLRSRSNDVRKPGFYKQ